MRPTWIALLAATATLAACAGSPAAPASQADIPDGEDTPPDLAPLDVAPDLTADPFATLTSGEASLLVQKSPPRLELRHDGVLRTAIDLTRIRLGRVPTFDPEWNYNPSELVNVEPQGLHWLHPTAASWAPHTLPPPDATRGFEPTGGATLWLSTADDAQIPGPELALACDGGGHGAFRCDLALREATLRADQDAEKASPAIVYSGLSLDVSPSERFYGLGEYFDTPQHRGKRRAMQIEVGFEQESGYNEAHVPVPLLVGTRGWGLFVESRRPGSFDVCATDASRVEAMFHVPRLRFWLLAEAHPLDVPGRYTRLTGAPAVPVRWAFGGMLWRNEHKSFDEVLADATAIRAHDLALSGMWVDRPYDAHVTDFGFDPVKFPDAKAHIDALRAKGLRLGLWHAPYLEAGAKLHDQAASQALFVKVPPKSDKLMKWGPPIDFTNPAAHALWKSALEAYTALGIEGYKLDYGEDIQLGLLQMRAHFTFFDGSDERTMHHGFALAYHRPYAETLGETGWLLNRAGAWGDQVYSSMIWPGDLCANLLHHAECDAGGKCHVGGLPAAVSAALSLATSGYPFFGSDTGGYRHTRPSKRTAMRWVSHTALSAVLQVGGGSNVNPWDFTEYDGSQFDAEVLDHFRAMIRLHTRLFPYLYTHARSAHDHGRGVIRPIGLAYPALEGHAALPLVEASEYLFGDALLVAPIVDANDTRTVLLPPGLWYDHWTHAPVGLPDVATAIEVTVPLDRVPLYARAGALVPLLRESIDTLATATEQGVDSFAGSPGRLDVWVTPGPSAAFTLYDGTALTMTTLEGGALTLVAKAGTEFAQGVTWQIWLQSGPNASPAEDGKPLAEVPDASVFASCEGCWRFDAAQKVLLVRPKAMGGSVGVGM